MLHVKQHVIEQRQLHTLIENRTTFGLQHAELNLFETHERCTGVLLTFPDPVLASMIMGKKIMHLGNKQGFAFLPGESVILPENETMNIDFPEASIHQPTKCLALRFNKEKLLHTIDLLNEQQPKQDGQQWSLTDYNFHFTNDAGINQLLQRFIFLFTEEHPSKDVFSNWMIQELLIRILQLEQKEKLLRDSFQNSNRHRFAYVIEFIRNNLNEKLSIHDLSHKANMSESSFYRAFKQETGISPNEFIIEQKLKHAETILRDKRMSIKEAYLSSGFSSFSYFCKLFKKRNHMQPGEYRERFS